MISNTAGKYLSFALLLFLFLLATLYANHYRFNVSNSYPPGLYQLLPPPEVYLKGDLVLFCPPEGPAMQLALSRDYIKPGLCRGGFTPVIKKVMATAGDRITLTDSIRINDAPMIGYRILKTDRHQRPLPRLDSLTVPPDSVFLLSDHRPADSFDSRYYGAVPVSQVKGLIRPVLTSGG
ncbi:conjugative transfer signal peptidase TraF [Lelliottia aquatilis]|uniref:conjugative transfer signal peptidase TraF n=1 Tax=Lelliottia aquatilis TaxID=2080838 RepID=UPI0015774C7C|nr:conjugative transfer signal peptidase TraF [Lelliottia aquatilis]NTZ47717.1 conjugative transfer signal peptidase TraF [Lelliottia aquatilis]